jgi:hypothetical protein
MIDLLCFVGIVVFILVTFSQILSNNDKKLISLYVLVDNEGRVSYTGSEEQCKAKLTEELKLIKLEGIL